jgi:4-amino-4-deoxy-L-arabinose transferase-like glycosyltransferase
MEKIIKTLLVAMLAVSVGLVFWAVFTTPEDPTVENATAVGVYLYWGYALMAAAVVAALLGAAMDMFKAPSGVKRTIFSFVAIVGLIVGAYVIANGHDYQIVDLGNQGFFERCETVISDASLIVFYVAMAGAILSAIYSAVSDALK